MDQAELAQFESVAAALYDPTNPAHAEANAQVMALQESADFIPQCQSVLENSSHPQALLVATKIVSSLVMRFWNNFNAEQRLELATFLLTLLGSRGPMLESFVVDALVEVVVRVSKNGWFENARFREVVMEADNFLQTSADHHIVGLFLLASLVQEINTPASGRTATHHRRTAVSFRDNFLLKLFRTGLDSLQRLSVGELGQVTDAQTESIGEQALHLCLNCLRFDFIGTSPDESSDDISTVQLPAVWRPEIQNPQTLQLFFAYYSNTNPPRSSLAMQCIVMLSSVRRSIFNPDKERAQFLQNMLSGVREILREQRGMNHPDNYHQFCRLLGRLKANYQLSELVHTPEFEEWLAMCADLTIQSLRDWQYSSNSLHYLLQLWGRLVAAIPYMRNDQDTAPKAELLRERVMDVAQCYTETMLGSVEVVVTSGGDIDNPLDDEGLVKDQMDRFPILARLQYPHMMEMIATCFDTTNNMYQQALQSYTPDAETLQRLEICEGRLTWLVYMISSIILHANDDKSSEQGTEQLDGTLSRLVLQLAQGIDYRLANTNGSARCSEHLERALLQYFQTFKKVYLSDHAFGQSQSQSSSQHHALPLHIAMTVSHQGKMATESESRPVPYQTMYQALGLGDAQAVVNIIVTKLCNNIKFYCQNESMLRLTLDAFVDVVSAYRSNKALLALEPVRFILHHHNADHFPFLSLTSNNKFRITFHTALARLAFATSEDLDSTFDDFVTPTLEVLGQLRATEDLRPPEVRMALICVFRDLRGITAATHNRRTYGMLFDILYPDFFPVFQNTAQQLYDDYEVMTALLKFMQEFVYNKGQRVTFDLSSPNGLLLFRETSAIVVSYGSQALNLPVQQNIYKEKYKCITLVLNVLTCALGGNYVNFGVFALYEDPALQNALDYALQLCLNIPTSEVLAYPKLSRGLYSFLEILFRNHLETLSALDSGVFVSIMERIHGGLEESEDVPVVMLCAGAIDHLATFYFLNMRKEKPTVRQIAAHIQTRPEMFTEIMVTLFHQLLFSPQTHHWAVTRPILSLMLASEDGFTACRERLLASQSPEKREELEREFASLVHELPRSLETSNRDRFTQKLTLFRWQVRRFWEM